MSAQQTRTNLGRPTAKKAHPRPARGSKRWYALTIVAAVCAIIIYLGVSAPFGSFQSQRIAEQSAPTLDSESRTGKIVLQTNPDQCEQIKFDNANGRFIDGLKPCDNQIQFDDHGRPIPLGTIHRLDAINRSFFGR